MYTPSSPLLIIYSLASQLHHSNSHDLALSLLILDLLLLVLFQVSVKVLPLLGVFQHTSEFFIISLCRLLTNM